MTLALISIACISDVSSLQAMLIYARIIYAMDLSFIILSNTEPRVRAAIRNINLPYWSTNGEFYWCVCVSVSE